MTAQNINDPLHKTSKRSQLLLC